MQTTLLDTKLFVPPARETLVARPRLVDILSKAQEFILVSAPAGYGKTTLVSAWLREAGIPTAWLSLEEADNDPIRFLQYLLTALHDIIESIHFDLLDLVEGGQPAALQALMNILINEIARSEGRFVLVLDDFHLIQDSSILAMMTCLLDHFPARQMHLVLGLQYGSTLNSDDAVRLHTYQHVQVLIHCYQEIHGSIQCTDLLGYNLSNPEQFKTVCEKGLFNQRCPIFVRDAARILSELLEMATPTGPTFGKVHIDKAYNPWKPER